MKFIISGGGTGGHIYPAIAIANELKKLDKNTEILFVGANGRMEMEKVPKAGYHIEGLDISGIERKLSWKNLLLPFKIWASISKSKKIIKNFKPDAVVGVGGYASGPLLYAATQLKIPALIQEQNSFAGITNKILSKKVQKICVAYQGMEKFFPKEKILMTGNPVRQDILEVKEKNIEDYQFFNLDIHKKTILIIGGSLGARSINQAISANLHLFIENDIQILWQTGKNSYQNHPQESELLKNPLLKKVEFIYEMNRAYGIADIVISRAGALAVSEICLVKKPAIFVPLPTAAEDHQTQNALALVNQNAAQMVKDTEAYEILAKEAIKLLYDEQKCTTFQNNLSLFAKPNATQEIAKEVIKLVK